ncbi:hypothetical protein BH09VER1_BH09VER1_26930 [soil metagenome]
MSRSKISVLLLTDSADLRTSQIAKGVLKACHKLDWEMRWQESQSLESGLEDARAIIVSMNLRQLRSIAKRIPKNVPLISVNGTTLDTDIPTVAPNPEEIGTITARHFLEQGLMNFAFVGTLTHPSARRRNLAYQKVVSENLSNFSMAEFHVPHEDRFWGRSSVIGKRFLRFLKKCPMPLGIMAASDHAAVSCLESLTEAGFRSPQEISVVGAHNDPVYTALIMPLSSIQIDFERIGALAVEMVRQRISSRRVRSGHEYVSGELVVRRSSQLRLMVDERISRAVEILQSHHTEEMTLPSLAKLCGMSRASLASKFTEAVGESPIRYLINYRLDRAGYLLAETNLSINQISEKVGFHEQPYFTRAFRKKFGKTPSAYRQLRLQSQTSGGTD